MIPSPVKAYAVEKGIECFCPAKIKTEDSVEILRKYKADIFVVAAFGQILSKEILDMPRYGCVNVHASLLPKYRGAAPIQWAIADGNENTGVTIMQMNEGLDTGDILTQVTVPIASDETGESLFDKLMDAGAKLLNETLPMIESGEITPIAQDEINATYAKILKKEMGLIDFTMSAHDIDNRVRAFTPWPGGYTYYNGKILKLKKICAVDVEDSECCDTDNGDPGEIIKITKDALYIACGEDVVRIDELQPEGKKSMTTHDFLLGNKIEIGTLLGK